MHQFPFPFSWLMLVTALLLPSCTDNEENPPDLSSCACSSISNEIICGSDGRIYLDACFAQCLNIEIINVGNCPGANNDASDTLRWPIESICIPLSRPDDPQPQYTLGDGSIIYRNPDGSLFRGTPNFCRCLPGETLIGTPEGDRRIDQLKSGDPVYSVNAKNERIIRCIHLIRSVTIPADYKMLQLKLDDGRQLTVSPQHPDARGEPLIKLEIGACLDGGKLIEKRIIKYSGSFTWDILPEGEFPVYFANDILIGSTLQSLSPTL